MLNALLLRLKKGMPTDKHYKALMKSMLLIGVVVPLIPMVLVSGIILYQSQASYEKEIQTRFEEIVQQGTKSIDHFLKERLADINILADTCSFEQLREESFLQEILRKLRTQYGPAFSDLEVIDDEGLRVAYAGPVKSANARHPGSGWYQEVMNTGHVISDVTSGSDDPPHLIMALRKNWMGKDWVLRTAIDGGALNTLSEEIGNGNNGSAFIINREGQYQAGPLYGINSGKDILMDFLGIKEGQKKGTAFFQRTNGAGNKHIYATTFLKEGDWILVYRQRASEVFSGLRKTKTTALVVILIVGLLVGTNTLSLSKKMVARIQQADKEKQKQNEQMFQTGKLASIGELAAGIAHEINNPVAIMVEEAGWLDDLLEEEEFQETVNLEEFKRALMQIQTQGKRCKEITHKLLNFARRTDFKVQSFELKDMIRNIIVILEKKAKYSDIVIHTDIQKDLPELTLPETELQQVLFNLINNALDAMEEKGGTLFITARLIEDHIVIQVSDNGPGIPKEDLPRIFDPFFTTKPIGKGTGLGLSICYGIVKKMSGEIDVRSMVNEGTTFTIKIPFKEEGKSKRDDSLEI